MSETKDIYLINNYPNKSGKPAYCILEVDLCSTRELMGIIENSNHHINDIVKHNYIICEITHTGLKIPDEYHGYKQMILAENKLNRTNRKNGYDFDEVTRLITDTFSMKRLHDSIHKKWKLTLSN